MKSCNCHADAEAEGLSTELVGACVQLDNGEPAEVLHVPAMDLTKPVVRVAGHELDLSGETNRRIVRMLAQEEEGEAGKAEPDCLTYA